MYNYKAICCKNIPELFLDKLVARQHFSQFGQITRFVLQPRRMTCTVAFETEAEADRARLDGDVFKGHKFEIDFAEHETNISVQNTEDWINPEVQTELDALWRTESKKSSFNTQSITRFLGLASAKPTPRPTAAASTVNTFGSIGAVATAAAAAVTGNKVAPNKIDQQLRKESSGHELRTIMRKPAYTAEEKYRVLDARDKLVRIINARKQKLVKAVATKGTCPDMCPEKERFMREFQRQVSSFEQLEGNEQVICHKRAIKEYSRSSADQEAPLPHDLRTEAALHMTMSYLMHNIIDLCDDPDVSIGDWFHFVWDRTRSIRKDITQQELCSLGAVKLIEQCARFHIHCAARLVAEEPSVFDSKINAENLTKCLQTLKYMYQDLRLKNINCVSEPEFRSYIVLLNLRDANFLWDIQQLPIHIQSSEPIRRAIAYYNALQDNNFVRFFDMMRQPETSYMSACILLGYCYRLRIRAMDVLIKAHKWPKKDAFLPLSLIAKSLGFMDKSVTKGFLEAHGLRCDVNRVLIDRMDTPVSYKMEREEFLVESKRTVKVGECICGEKLPSPDIFDRHIPSDSFDENGILKPEAWKAEDQLKNDFTERSESKDKKFKDVIAEKETFKSSDLQELKATSKVPQDNIFKIPQAAAPLAQLRQQSQSPKPQLFSSNTNIFGFDKSTTPTSFKIMTPLPTLDFTDILGNTQTKSSLFQPIGITSEAAKSHFGTWPNKPQQSIFGTPQRDLMKPMIPMGTAEKQVEVEQNTQELERLRAEEAARQRAEEEARQRAEEEARQRAEEQAAAARRAREQEKIAKEQAKQARKKEKERRRQLKAKRDAAIEATAQQLYSTLLNSYIHEEIAQAVDDALEEIQAIERFYQQLSVRVFNEILDDIITRDALKIRVNFHYEQNLLKRCFSAWVAFNRKQRAERKRFETTSFWSTQSRQQQAVDITMHNHEDTIAMMRRYRQGEACDFNKLMQRSHTVVAKENAKLDMWRLLQATLPTKKLGAQHYIKLLFTLPDDNEELLGFKSKCEYWMKHNLLKGHHHQPFEGAFINEISHNVALCVRKVCGVCPLNESGQLATKELEHCDGIVCFMTPQQLHKTRNRLHNVSKSSNRIVIILFDGESISEHQLAKHLNIHNMNFESYRFFGCLVSKSRFNFTKMLHDAVKFLALQIKIHHYNHNNERLQQQALIPFTTVHLGEELWHRWKSSAINNPYFGCALRDAQLLWGLYNEAVTRTQSIATERFQNVKLFPYDLKCHVPTVSLDVPRDLEHFVPDWHTEAYRRRLSKTFESIKLPELPLFPDPSMDLCNVDKFEESLSLWLLNYGEVCLPHNEELSITTSFTAMQEFVMQMNRNELSLLTLTEKLQTINYWPILKSFAIARLDTVLRKECPPAVVYCCKQLESFENIPWWLNYKPVGEISLDSTNMVEWISKEEAANRQRMSEKKDQDALHYIEKDTDSLINRLKKRKACAPSNVNELTETIDKRIKLTELRELEFAKENRLDSDNMQINSVSIENATSSSSKNSPFKSINNNNNIIDIKNMETLSNETIENVLKHASNLLQRINGK